MYGYVYRTLLIAVILVALVIYAAFRLIGTPDNAGDLLAKAQAMSAQSGSNEGSPDASRGPQDPGNNAVKIIPAGSPPASQGDDEGWFDDGDADEVIFDEPQPDDGAFLIEDPQPFSAEPQSFNDGFNDDLPAHDAPFDPSPMEAGEDGWGEEVG